jgi:ADP-ribose pyrophosphatase YjhB (NUDIX family)/predicted transcriptional regulator
MKTQLEIHEIQAKILRELLFKPQARFSELNIKELSSDHFTFHITKLVENNLVEKTTEGKYTLTAKGKELANRLDTDTAKIERQGKVAVCILCEKKENNKTYYLVQKRLKQPYYGFHGYITGKIRWGETVFETAARELKEETNMETKKITLKGIEHKMDYDPKQNILEDKFFFVCKAQDLSGEMFQQFEGGQNIWYTEDEIKNLTDLFPDVEALLHMIQQRTIQLQELKFTVDKY